jgi:transcriptional regulator with XRE-family HTH domain
MSIVPTPPPYFAFGEVLSKARAAVGAGNQREFAIQLGVAQQSVSRWEKGLSRPRAKDLPAIAKLLDMQESELFAAAGYAPVDSPTIVSATTFDRPLPVNALSPISFERFCTYLVEGLYRGLDGRVEMQGGSGHDQDGTDIVATGPFGIHSFQCKRVEEFGAQKVHTAVAMHRFEADSKFLLLANIASPKAREAIRSHPDWEIWDREDITRKFRTLPITDQITIVDIFFQGKRQDLLGRPDAGALVSPTEFYKPFLKDQQLFNHRWNLIGRDKEVEELWDTITKGSADITLLVGPAGNGKTRILYEVVKKLESEHRSLLVLFASPTEEVKSVHLDNLGLGPKLIVSDDAHDSEDTATLINFCANPDNNARLLFALRPYGEEQLRHTAANFGINAARVRTVQILPQTRQDARALALEVLATSNSPSDSADAIADATFGTPLVTVLGAQLVARDKVNPALLNNVDDFRAAVLGKLQDVITGSIVTGLDTPKMLAVLRTVALVQPIFPDDPALLRLLKDIEGVDSTDSMRLLRILSVAGVLFKRGLRHRLAPDLLADAIIQRDLIKDNGAAGEKIEQIFDAASEEHLKNMLLNLARLEWRMMDGDTSGARLLPSFSSKLQWEKPHHVKAIESVAYFQPSLALNFASKLIREGHGDDANVCGMVRNAAYNFPHLQEACSLLWKAGRKNPRALHQTPAHGIRILKSLASFQLNKPKQYVNVVVDFALDLLKSPNSLNGTYTPFDILEGALNAEMEETKYTRLEYTITTYALEFEFVRETRSRIMNAMFACITNGPPRKAFLAISTIAYAMRGPLRFPPSDNSWSNARQLLLENLSATLTSTSHSLHPIVLVKAASIVRGEAYHGGEESRALASSIIELTNRDLTTRLARVLIDGWGHETWNIADPARREEHVHTRKLLIEELRVAYPLVPDLYAVVSHWLDELNKIGPGFGTPQMFINQLITEVPGFSGELFRNYVLDSQNPLSVYTGAALGKLLEEQQSEAIRLALPLVKANIKELRLFADAYTRYHPQEGYSEEDLAMLRLLFVSKDPHVLRIASNVALQVSRVAPELAIELIGTVNLTAAGSAADDFYMWLANDNAIPEQSISPPQWLSLISNLSTAHKLDDYWIHEFLKKAIRIHPNEVMELFKLRLLKFAESEDWSFAPLRPDHNGEGLGIFDQENGARLLRDFLDWVLKNPKLEVILFRVGDVIAGVCGKYDSRLLELLLSWMSHATEKHASLVAAILQEAQNEFIYEFPQFVRDILYIGEAISDSSVDTLSSAIASSTWGGVKHGTPGEPFPEDVRCEKYAAEMLANMSRADPAYDLFDNLLRTAREQILRQSRTKEALDEEEED